jgi:hypothetical protein
MGYLHLSADTLAMSRVVISFWFRIPDETVTAARQQRDAYPLTLYPTVFHGIIPLLVFGNQIGAPVMQLEPHNVGNWYVQPAPGAPATLQPYIEFYPVAGPLVPYAPSYIGIDCNDDDGIYVTVNLQTNDYPTTSGSTYRAKEVAPTGHGEPLTNTDIHYIDVSSSGDVIPQLYNGVCRAVKMTPDAWHHLLLSYDVTNEIRTHGVPREDSDGTDMQGTSNYNLMWFALDDVNYKEYDLPAYWISGGPANAILPSGIPVASPWHVVNPAIGPIHRYYPGGADGPMSYICLATSLPAQVLSIPGLPDYQSGDGRQMPVHHIEMAEMQIFMNMTMDTSIKSNRRAFIEVTEGSTDEPDEPHTLKPVKPEKTEELLHRRPDILLHRVSNWKEGKNTGSLGLKRVDGQPDEILPGGQFEPTGTILKYTPDPSIETGA